MKSKSPCWSFWASQSFWFTKEICTLYHYCFYKVCQAGRYSKQRNPNCSSSNFWTMVMPFWNAIEACNRSRERIMFRIVWRLIPSHASFAFKNNGQAEVANKTIAKYLSSFVDETTLDWEVYLPPLMIVYNTSFHQSIKTTPCFLTFGMEPRLPNLPGPDVRRKSANELLLQLLTAHNVACCNNKTTTYKSQIDLNQNTVPHNFINNDLVLMDKHSFLGKNAKLSPKWSGPHQIIQLKNENNFKLKMHNGHSLIMDVNWLKPYAFGWFPWIQRTGCCSAPLNLCNVSLKVRLIFMTFLMTPILCPSMNHSSFHFHLSPWLKLKFLMMGQ